MDISQKKEILEENIRRLGKIAVAFSSGVDSTFLLKTAHDILGDNVIAITARACCFLKEEMREAEEFCKKEGIKQIVIDYYPLEIGEFKNNVQNRCYFCKKALFTEVKALALENGFENVAEGTNFDDLSDFRPGMKAIDELGILSPLLDAKLTKEEIRFLSKEAGLSTCDKPSCACLASRIAYNEEITEEKLSMIEKAEEKLHSLGFIQARVRMHGKMARIEVEKENFMNLLLNSDEISAYLKFLGFTFVSMDLEGYKTGKMNVDIYNAKRMG